MVPSPTFVTPVPPSVQHDWVLESYPLEPQHWLPVETTGMPLLSLQQTCVRESYGSVPQQLSPGPTLAFSLESPQQACLVESYAAKSKQHDRGRGYPIRSVICAPQQN